MENAKLLSLVYSLVLWFNILLCKYLEYILLFNYKNQRVNPNKIHLKIHICNNTTFVVIWKHIKIIWNWKQNTKYNVIQMFFSIKKSFLAPITSFSSSSKTIQCPNNHKLKTFPLSPSWFPHEHEFNFPSSPNHLVTHS
jgi:hypothetical protein